jgi:hypothetical protein
MKPNGLSFFDPRPRPRVHHRRFGRGTLLLPRRRLIARPVTTLEIPPGTLLCFYTDG